MRRAVIASLLSGLFALASAPAAQAQLSSIPSAPATTSLPGPRTFSTPGRPDVIDQARQRALAPMPRAPEPPAATQVWVPEQRFYSSELQRDLVVPGHYETRITDQQYGVPPLTVYGPQGQQPMLIPGGERAPGAVRQAP
jgi:hypothetical protein